MRPNTLAVAVLALLSGATSPVLAQLSPGATTTPAPTLSTQQKQTAVDSSTQATVNTTANVTLPAINMVIQQTLLGRSITGQRAAVDLVPAHRGQAAGDDAIGWQAWVQGNGGNSSSSLSVGGYNLGTYGTQAGLQAQLTPKLLLGISGSWQGSSGSMNGGFSSTNSTFGGTLYGGWQFDEAWNASATVGYSSGSSTMTNGLPSYNASYASSQWNFQGGLNGYYKVGRVVLSPAVSLLYTTINNYGYVDSAAVAVPGRSTQLTRGSAGGFISLPLDGWQPYVRATIEHDFAMPTGSEANGDTGGTVGVGATIPFNDTVWASIDGGYNSIGRIGLSLWSASARINVRF